VIGLFGGVGLAFFFEYLDDTVKDLSDIERTVEWPFLGSVPEIDTREKKLSETEKDMLVHVKPKDPIAEAIRSIRTSIIFSSTEEHPIKAVVITSAAPQEGKTTTACNLAIAMAQNNKRVLIVDADMRNPRLQYVFKKENKEGLSTYLASQTKFSDILRATDIENLSLITSGIHPPNPSELLASVKMTEFVKEAKAKFDFILFDTPPITILTDPAILSRIADGLIMVVESGKTSKRVIPRIGQILDNAKARVIGVIFNKISIKTSDYYYYYSRYYGK
jgi:capsular exopolysaccharide synthesis family protein